jgi:hypothetical protein
MGAGKGGESALTAGAKEKPGKVQARHQEAREEGGRNSKSGTVSRRQSDGVGHGSTFQCGM